MRKLWADKRQKLQDIVDAARRRVEEEQRLPQDALQKELDDLENAKAEVIRKPRLGPAKDAIGEQEAKIKELEKLIAEKQACLEELKQAQADLEDALRRLAEAEAKLKEAEQSVVAQKSEIRKENGDIPPAQADLEAAEDDLARARARHEAAMGKLRKAKADLAEHDDDGKPTRRAAEVPLGPARSGDGQAQEGQGGPRA